MMFFKATIALYFAAIALAAPTLVDVGDICKSRVNPYSLCTGLSTAVAVDHDDILNGVGNVVGNDVDVL